VANEIWHGVGVTQNGFAVRFNEGGRAQVRLFNNDGAPKGANIDLGTLANQEGAAGGGRGDGALQRQRRKQRQQGEHSGGDRGH